MRFFIISLLFLWFGSSQLRAETPKIYLEAGQTKLLDMPEGASLQLSQRKVVDVEWVGKNQVRLIALKSGLVLIKATAGDIESSWFIEVLSRDQQNDWLLHTEWQTFFCAHAGVQCDKENKVITGETAELEWFYEAKQLCKKKMPCTWQVQLSEAARERSELQIAPLLATLKFRMDKDGQLRIDSSCDDSDKKLLEKALTNIQEAYHITAQVECVPRDPDLWKIDVLVISDREGEGDISNPLRWEKIEVPSSKSLRAVVSELAQTMRMRIIAQPEMSLSLGGTAMLKDGQEIQTHAVQQNTDEILWKSSGFRLEVKLVEFRSDQARIQLHMNLSQPQAGLQTIDASEFASEVWLQPGYLQKIGSMDATLKGSGESRIPWLGSIPLIGFLFRWDEDTKAKRQLDIFLRIRPDAQTSGSTGKDDSSGTESRIRDQATPEAGPEGDQSPEHSHSSP